MMNKFTMQYSKAPINIEYINHYPIQIYKTSSLYKLNIRLKSKPVILTLHSLSVVKYIIDHSEYMKSLLQLESLEQLKIVIPGYGVFNQKYELEQIGYFFQKLAEYSQDSYRRVLKLQLEMPGWRTFSIPVLKNIFKFIRVCQNLMDLSLNFNHIMNLLPIISKEDQQQDNFYDKRLFKTEQYEQLLKQLGNLFVGHTNNIQSKLDKNEPIRLRKLQLKFGGWQGIDARIIQLLAQHLQRIFHRDLKILKIDINGWGSASSIIDMEVIDKMFKVLEDFECEYELIEIDMRNWASKYKIQKYKERFQILSGVNRKSDQSPFSGFHSMTGTQFFGSQIKSKLSRPVRVEIKI